MYFEIALFVLTYVVAPVVAANTKQFWNGNENENENENENDYNCIVPDKYQSPQRKSPRKDKKLLVSDFYY